jgi:hypothetical protein
VLRDRKLSVSLCVFVRRFTVTVLPSVPNSMLMVPLGHEHIWNRRIPIDIDEDDIINFHDCDELRQIPGVTQFNEYLRCM